MEILNDQRLNAEDIGVLAYWLTKPDSWSPRVRDLKRRFGWGEQRAARVIGRLKKFGYVQTVAERGPDGRLAGTSLHVHETPKPSAVASTRSSQPGSTETALFRASVQPNLGQVPPLVTTENTSNDRHFLCRISTR